MSGDFRPYSGVKFFRFCEDIREKHVSRSLWLCWHPVNYFLKKKNYYSNYKSKINLFWYYPKIACPRRCLLRWHMLTYRSRCLCGHSVGAVIDYSDDSMTMRTPREHFGGLSLTLTEQSSEKRCLGAFTYPIAIFRKYEIGGLLNAKIVCPRSSWLRGHAYFEFVNVEYPCKQEQFCETDLAAARMSKTIEVEYFVTLTL